MKRIMLCLLAAVAAVCAAAQGRFTFGAFVRPDGVAWEVTSRGFRVGGRDVLPVMGEIHYTRVRPEEWGREVAKMRAGGITVVSTYVFWNHHEARRGHWDWRGQRSLRAFLQVCQREGMPVVLRIGPFAHGEAYQGGLPAWLTDLAARDASYKVRTQASGFMACARELYRQIARQARGLLWKDGGPVVGVQIENESRGPWAYLMALRRMAVEAGFDVPFMTRTGWPQLTDQEEFGLLLPLYGDYADGFWDRKLTDMPGAYRQAFEMRRQRMSRAIATDAFGEADFRADTALSYPYLTCELGGGMASAYHRRILLSGREAYALAVCKLGSGSNLPGYYMYHGGVNPAGTRGECQASAVTNYNDLPQMMYDFQAPLGALGRPLWAAYHETRWLHQLLATWGGELSAYGVDTLSATYARRGPFVFRNTYVRLLHEEGRTSVGVEGLAWRGHTVSTSALPFTHLGRTLYLIAEAGDTLAVDGERREVGPDGWVMAGADTVALLSRATARRAYVVDGRMCYARHADAIIYKERGRAREEWWTTGEAVPVWLVRAGGAPRKVGLGRQGVAEQPADSCYEEAAVYTFDAPASGYAEITYEGDCARVYAGGRMVMDDFWNGRPLLVRARGRVEVRVLAAEAGAPIYYPRPAGKARVVEVREVRRTLADRGLESPRSMPWAAHSRGPRAGKPALHAVGGALVFDSIVIVCDSGVGAVVRIFAA